MRIATVLGMTSSPAIQRPSKKAAAARPVLLWVFRREFNAIACEIAVAPSGGCEVRVIPQWDPTLASRERFDHVSEALRRHAEIACALRDIGWNVVERIPAQTLAA
jgi:hypothetical protein